MRLLSVARGNIAGRARRIGLPLCWLIGAVGTACGADAGGGSDERAGASESVNALSSADRATAPASSAAREAVEPSDDAHRAVEPSELSEPSTSPITAPPSEEPGPLPHAALDTPRSLDRLAPAEVLIEPGDCRFEFLGESVRCENARSSNVLETDAPDLVTCMRRCLERDDCTAVTDYLWLGRADLGCYLYLSACGQPAFSAWAEEDAGRDFRRRCDAPSD